MLEISLANRIADSASQDQILSFLCSNIWKLESRSGEMRVVGKEPFLVVRSGVFEILVGLVEIRVAIDNSASKDQTRCFNLELQNG